LEGVLNNLSSQESFENVKDLTFITNESGCTLYDRFNTLIKDTQQFDVLVAYFFISGFYKIYPSLENVEKIRIIVGINTDKRISELANISADFNTSGVDYSSAEAKQITEEYISGELENCEDSLEIEKGIYKFIEWLQSGKLEIKALPSERIHAKVYILTFTKGDRDKGRVITGSSNFTSAGLMDNFEFNVELKNYSDYQFALHKFNELWRYAVDIKDKYIDTIQIKTWLNDTITPYELYLKFLYEYFKTDLSRPEYIAYQYLPEGFLKLEYQSQAVLNAKKILDEYGGVFISDVVGLGKTYISAMLAQQLDGRNLVIAPPVMLDDKNLGSWVNVFRDFNVPATFYSVGKLEELIVKGIEGYKNVFIDEAHRFRTETTISYEKLAQICRGKRVVLVTATPYNNSPKDILSQIKLFQKVKKSTIPNLPNLERFFNHLNERLKELDRKDDYPEYIETVRQNAKEIREKVLKYLMVRRTRSEITTYFNKDLEEQHLKFPDVADPEPFFYELDINENEVFEQTIKILLGKFKYARYMPMLYFKGEITQPEELAQRNMGKFMKILVIKRMESSFFAFRKTLDRFIHSYEIFLKEIELGHVFISKKYSNKIIEFIENDDEEAIQRLIDEDKAKEYSAEDFKPELKQDLEFDLNALLEIKNLWSSIHRDPKLLKLLKEFNSRQLLKTQKIVLFTESKETATYLFKKMESIAPGKVLIYTGGSSISDREKVIENFDAKARFPKDDYRILVSTEVLSEGVNLHRSNVVINYDIPWNPTRMMQRVGRVNRVDTKFDNIFTFNFFPTEQSNDLIKLKESAEAKIHAFISLLGSDARLLTEGEPIESHELFEKLMSKRTLTGEDDEEESELRYLRQIKDLRDNDPGLFEKIKRLPRKARTGRKGHENECSLITYFRKGKIQKFFRAKPQNESIELDFMTSAKLLEATPEVNREKIEKKYYELLNKNKEALDLALRNEYPEEKRRGGWRDSAIQVYRILKARDIVEYQGFTDDDEDYIKGVLKEIEEGGLPKQTTKIIIKELNNEIKNDINPLKILAIVRKNIPIEFITKEHYAQTLAEASGPREVILSEYFEGSHEQ